MYIVSVQYNLGIVFTELKENEKAIKCYEKVIAINPKVADPHNNLGLIYYELGNREKALSYFEKFDKSITEKYINENSGATNKIVETL